MKTKKLIVRLAALLIVLALAAVMFIIGRGHTIYIDNKTLEYEGETYSAYYKTEVYVNGDRLAKLMKKERGSTTCLGQHFTMDIEVTEKKGDDPVRYTIDLTLPYALDGIVVNIPGYLAGLSQDAWMTEFVSQAQDTSTEEEEIVTDEFGLGDI